jgi:hypothetical protein
MARAGQAPSLQPPARVDYTHGIKDWGMMLNDKLGCCTIAALGHAVQIWTVNALGRELTVPDATILKYYEQWDGYNPADCFSDQGGVELDVLNDWRQQGFDGNSLDAYVSIDVHGSSPSSNRVSGRSGDRVSSRQSESSVQRIAGSTNASLLSADMEPADHPITRSFAQPINRLPAPPIPQIATAIWLFGGAYIGVELPITAQDQDVWDVPNNPGPNDDPGSWGGHAIYLVGYDFPESPVPNPESRTLTCITWGRTKKMTWAWFEKYCSEAYALVSKEWLNTSGVSPSGFDLAALEKDLEVVSRQPPALSYQVGA